MCRLKLRIIYQYGMEITLSTILNFILIFICSFVLYKIAVYYALPLFICEAAALLNLIPIVIWAPVPIKEQKQIQTFMSGLLYKLSDNCEIVIVSDNFIKC